MEKKKTTKTSTAKSPTAKEVSKTNGHKSTGNSKSTEKNGSDSRLDEFFHEELKDIYWAEKHLVKTLPVMRDAANSNELQTAFESHLAVTKEHVSRLEQVFELLGHRPQGKKCEAMEGLTKEGDSIIEDTEEGTATRDVGLIMAAQKVEHYEIATYGALVQLARTLGKDELVTILEKTLHEEKDADAALTDIAENDINYEASQETTAAAH